MNNPNDRGTVGGGNAFAVRLESRPRNNMPYAYEPWSLYYRGLGSNGVDETVEEFETAKRESEKLMLGKYYVTCGLARKYISSGNIDRPPAIQKNTRTKTLI